MSAPQPDPALLAEAIAALEETADAVNISLGMVEKRGPDNIPNWDWLREVRRRAAATLAKLKGERTDAR